MKMKKVYHHLSELMAILCLAGMVSCSSDDIVNDTPDMNGTVNTQFVLSVSTASSASTRMSDANTQALTTSDFRGIDHATLLGYKLGTNGKYLTTTTTPSKVYDLDVVGDITASDARHVVNLDLELNTNTLLFYGKAIKDGTDQQQGKIDFHVGTGGSDTYFALQSRVDDADELGDYETALEAILNDVIGASYSTTSWASYGTDFKDDTKVGSMNGLEKTLGEAYVILTTMGENEARAGSGSAILRTIDDLWKYVTPVTESTPSNDKETTAKAVADAIVTKLNAHFEYDSEELKFKAYSSGDISLSSAQLGGFPVNLNLPAGAEQLIYAGGQFAFNASASLGMDAGTAVGNISWPAELCYFGNSPVRTSTAIKNKEDLPATISSWEDDTEWTGFEKNSQVLSSTRTVAMQNDINYGTALLETTVKYGAGTLNDNNSGIHTGEDDNTIDATTDSPFQLTGILVGGQYNKVGWDYLPLTTAVGVSDAYVIYDNDLSDDAKTIPAYTVTPTASAPNYTLVFDNYVPDETQKSVIVCLEFKNNSGKDFYGESNLIAKGETFYLIGKLQLPASPSIAFPDQSSGDPCHALPPYNSTTGYTDPVPRVFIQDYVTKANFVIGANSLKKAFVTVPDLRITELSLGLAVDLSWGTGPVFNNIELGD